MNQQDTRRRLIVTTPLVQGRSTSGRAPPRTRETMSPPHRKFPKALKNCAEVIELGKDAISYCLVRRAPRQTLAAPSRSHLIAQRRAVWDHTKCTSGRQPCPRAAVASRSFARSRRRRAERVRSGDDDVASGGGARIVHRRRGARAVLHVADAPVIEMNARSASNSTPEHRSEDPALTPPLPRPYPIQTQSCKRSRLKRFFSPGRACCSDCLKVRARPTRPAPPPADPTDSPFLICSVNITSSVKLPIRK